MKRSHVNSVCWIRTQSCHYKVTGLVSHFNSFVGLIFLSDQLKASGSLMSFLVPTEWSEEPQPGHKMSGTSSGVKLGWHASSSLDMLQAERVTVIFSFIFLSNCLLSPILVPELFICGVESGRGAQGTGLTLRSPFGLLAWQVFKCTTRDKCFYPWKYPCPCDWSVTPLPSAKIHELPFQMVLPHALEIQPHLQLLCPVSILPPWEIHICSEGYLHHFVLQTRWDFSLHSAVAWAII